MRKILPLLFVFAIFSSVVLAGQFVPSSSDNIVIQPTTIVDAGLVDTLAGATDSITVFSYKQFEGGWMYLLKTGIITGGGADSVKINIYVDAYDKNKKRIGRYLADSITSYTGYTCLLPIERSVSAAYYTIKAHAYTGNGGEVILNDWSIDKAKYVK